MKTSVLLFIFTLLFASCNKEEDIKIEDLNLTQTVWRGTFTKHIIENENVSIVEGNLQISFISDNTGLLSMERFYDNNKERFYYTHNKNQLTIEHTALGGVWIIAQNNKNTITMTLFLDYEKADILELERVDNQ